jgi:hypothetical protein
MATQGADPTPRTRRRRLLRWAILGACVVAVAAFVSVLLVARLSDGSPLPRMQSLHASLRPGMSYDQVVAAVDRVEGAWWRCVDAATPRVPPCSVIQLSVASRGAEYVSTVRLDGSGALAEIGEIEYVD